MFAAGICSGASRLSGEELYAARMLLKDHVKETAECKFLFREGSTYWFRRGRQMLGVSYVWGFKDRGEVFDGAL